MPVDQLFITSHDKDLAYVRQASSIEHLVDRFVYPLDECPVTPIVSCEDSLEFVGSFQLVSGTAYCDRFAGECYPEVSEARLLVVPDGES